MKLKTKNLTAILLAVLALSLQLNGPIFAAPMADSQNDPAPLSAKGLNIAAAFPKVQVINLRQNFGVSVKVAIEAREVCRVSADAGSNLVQDAAPLDLNQPARCFAINYGKAPALKQLAVKPLAGQRAKVAVIVSPVAIVKVALTETKGSNVAPLIMPLAQSLARAFANFNNRAEGNKDKANNVSKTENNHFSAYFILRC